MTEEIWKPCEECYYLEVSSHGSVRSIDRIAKNGLFFIKGKILKKQLLKSGRYYVHCYDKNKQKNIAVHKLVALAFIGDRPKGLVINHIDGNKINNRVENLEYVTQKQNIQHSWKLGLTRPFKRDSHPLTKIKTCDFETIEELSKTKTIKDIARHYNCSQTIIVRALRKWRKLG